jgi:hypothetical protein
MTGSDADVAPVCPSDGCCEGGSDSREGTCGSDARQLLPCAIFREVGVLTNDVGSRARAMSKDGEVVVGSTIDYEG